jgi:hypothetical protein
MDGMTYHATVDVSTGHIEMDENPREIDESIANNKQVFANEVTQQDKQQLSHFFQNSNNDA